MENLAPILLAFSAVIVAVGGIIIPLVTLRATNKVHVLVNSEADRKDAALIRSNEMLAKALQDLYDERQEAKAAALDASKAAIEAAASNQPPA